MNQTLPGGGFTSAERRRRYGRLCACGCGRKTSGCNGAPDAPEYRQDCYNRKRRAEARLKVILAIREWHKEHGRLPAAREWRYGVAPIPTTSNVQSYFGSWNAAIEAAGFTPRKPGHREHRKAA